MHSLRLLAFTAIAMSLASPAWAQITVPPDGEPLRIGRIADIPRILMAAIARDRCQLLDSILREQPAVIFRPSPQSRAMAVVPCNGIVRFSLAYVFDLAMETPPLLMTLPVAGRLEGFSAADTAGLMTWDPAAKTLTAVATDDVCNVAERRHTYRHGRGDLNGFALVKVEQRKETCTAAVAEWQVMWEAKEWPLLQ